MTQQPVNRWQHDGRDADPWSALSSIIAGVLLWGAIGWAVSEWLHSRAYMGAGLVIGGVLGVMSVYLRYGRHQSGPPVTGGPVVFPGRTGAVPGALTPESARATPVPTAPTASLSAQPPAPTAEEDTP
ncbi:hypothetical protein acdb102_01200 [Acidothermaceae bacterium B102]|nr:hypothetical protein acdb102_01200 [Acidothermaceae bacterium B102]